MTDNHTGYGYVLVDAEGRRTGSIYETENQAWDGRTGGNFDYCGAFEDHKERMRALGFTVERVWGAEVKP